MEPRNLHLLQFPGTSGRWVRSYTSVFHLVLHTEITLSYSLPPYFLTKFQLLAVLRPTDVIKVQNSKQGSILGSTNAHAPAPTKEPQLNNERQPS